MDIRFWAATDTGLTRDHNEDNFLVDKKLKLFIVADGMGGHAAGEVASSVAVRETRRVIAEERSIVESFDLEDTPKGRVQLRNLLERALLAACARVFEMAQENPDRRGMGTTLSLLLLAGRRGFIAHVGDSRIYMSRLGKIHQITEDHSLVNELIRRGRLKPGDAFDNPYKNAVTRAVGVYESVEVDTFEFDLLTGDAFLLCSDGLSCYLDNALLLSYLSDTNIREIPERFIKHANNSGGKDNITAIVIQLPEEQGEQALERMAEVRQQIDTLRMIPLLKYLNYKDLVKVKGITQRRSFEAGEILFKENTRSDTLYILLEGRVQLSKGESLLTELEPGSHFGEMAMVDKAPRSATASALGPIKTLLIQRSAFYELMRSDPVLSVKLMWSFVQVLNIRLRISNQELMVARETIEQQHRSQSEPILTEMPPLMVGISRSLPVSVTDELVPGFLYTEAEQGTDPLLHAEEEHQSEG